MPMYQYDDNVYTLPELRALFPQVSLPAAPTADALAPLGVTVIPDPEPDTGAALAEAKAGRLADLADAFERSQQEGHFASSLGFEVDGTERANRDVQGLLTLMEATGATEKLFCDYGNVMRLVTLDQLKILQLELIVYGQMLYARKWELRAAIEAAENADAVAAVEINFDTLPAPTLSAEAV